MKKNKIIVFWLLLILTTSCETALQKYCGKFVVRSGTSSANYAQIVCDSVNMINKKTMDVWIDGKFNRIVADFIIVGRVPPCQ